MGIIKSKFRKMEEFDCSMDEMDAKINVESEDPRSPNAAISRTPLPPHNARSKSSIITRATNLANNISTPINNDLLMIQDKRFKHLAYSFIDPRSPSEGIVRTPIVMKSSDISSIVNTPRILEDELERDEFVEEDFQETFVERLSRLSFDDCLEQAEDNGQAHLPSSKLPDLMETHFDCFEQDDRMATVEPLKPTCVLPLQSAFDPRSPTIGIERTPLVFGAESKQPLNKDNLLLVPTKLSEQLLNEREEGGEDEETKEAAKENKDDEQQTKEIISIEEGATENAKKPTIVEPSNSEEVFVDVGRVIYGTPVQIAATGSQLVRTPLGCLGNRKRVEMNVNGKSPMVSQIPIKSNKKAQKAPQQATNLKVASNANNPFENTTPRKMIR